jgi:hypothetical protein
MRIYVAGPYSAPTTEGVLENVRRAVRIGLSLRLMGHDPFIPHLTYYVDVEAKMIGIDLGYEDFMSWDRSFQDTCEGFYYMGSSPGTDRELEHAQKTGQDIFRSISEVPWIA